MGRTTKPKPKQQPSSFRSFPLHDDPIFNELTAKQKKFVYNIFLQPITQWSNAQCYADAYDFDDYDNLDEVHKNQCYSGASVNIRKPKISHCIAKIREAYHTELYTNADRILREEASIAYSDPAEFFDEDGYLILPIHKLPMQVRKSISGFEVIESPRTGITKYKVTLWNKGQSLGRLQSIAGMNAAQKHELSGPNGGPIESINRNIQITLVRPDQETDAE